jgi:predicted transcriptional regulator
MAERGLSVAIATGKNYKDVKLLSGDERNLIDFINFFRRLVLLNENINLGAKLKNIQELLSLSEKIFSSQSTAEVFLYLCLHGAGTGFVIQSENNLSEATTYRIIKRLYNMGLIYPALKISNLRNTRGGPKPIVWAIRGASNEEIANAVRLHLKKINPKYLIAERLAQTILDEYLNKRQTNEITYREILIHIKEMRLPYRTPDIAELTAEYLLENGMKVWR